MAGTAATSAVRRQRIALAALYAVLTLLAVWIIHDFLPAVAWAGVIAIALWPLLQRLEAWPALRHRPRATAALLTLLVTVIFVLPLGLGVGQAAGEARALYGAARDIEQSGIAVPAWVQRLPVGARQVDAWWRTNLSEPGKAGHFAMRVPRATLLLYGRRFGGRVLHAIVQFGFTLLILFFVFASGSRLPAQLLDAARRGVGADGATLLVRMVGAVRGTVSGLVLVGCGEGLLLGIAYALTGVPHAALLGGVSAVAAMLPFCAPLLFCGAALYLFLNAAPVAGACLLGAGLLIVGVAEHFVRPALIGGSSRLPFLLVLLGILGGAETLGPLGLFVGPALMTVLTVFWREWVGASR
ncbi:AI-2E family transporter [Chitinasiproducens palmae]|uniref:AI-2E family transporter n=1 Tax=Chitinasiproducens palmae TaxID=1770053 RepID=UPI000B816D7B|nr:AI-2E family transporter [Chitinasiproducens palmae]